MRGISEGDLKHELQDLQEHYPKLSEDELFVLWFLRAFVADDERQAVGALVGGSGDKSVDAVYLDEATKTVVVVQGKYRKGIGVGLEKRPDVTAFAQLALAVCGDPTAFKEYCETLRPEVEQALTEARNRITKRGYRLQLYYVTTGKCSDGLRAEARSIARRAESSPSLDVIDGRQILRLLADYLDGVAPPVPTLELEIEVGKAGGSGGILQRLDHATEIESWVFSMTERSVAEMFSAAGIRLFARNVRGFLGSTEINRGMETTLRSEPEYFWYYNNGITIICDEAERKGKGGREVLHVANPQVINGQQTTRTLARVDGRSSGASVLVRVIRVPRTENSEARFETLVSNLVRATNWQNAIRPSDLMSNDRMQIDIERQFRKFDYLYLRKRQTRTEAKRYSRSHHQVLVKKEELAQAVAACDLDPSIVREGKEGLFEEPVYQQVFPTADPLYYLARYQLSREVSSSAWGYPERAYAKWVVLHFVWSELNPIIRGRAKTEAFHEACRHKKRAVVTPLSRAIEAVYRSALAFYRAQRGKGQKALDVSTFFQRKRLHDEFVRFWRSSRNTQRQKFRKRMGSVARGLEE